MSDSNQTPKSNIPTPGSSLLKKPGTGIPSRLPTANTIRKNPSTASAQSTPDAASSTQQQTAPLTSISSTSIPTLASTSTTNLTSASSGSIKNLTKQETEDIAGFKSKIKDLEEKLETLKLKRAEDREKLREFDKFKLQIQQLNEFKTKSQEMISGLNKELQQSKQEAKNVKDEFDTYKEEMSNHEQRLEEMTVDKELAEARIEELQDELNRVNEKYEEVKLELDVLKGEIELNGVEGAASTFQQKQMEKEQETLKLALIKLRDLSLQDKNELNLLRKQSEELNQKITKLTKENETLKTENSSYLIQINELKDQVTATLGSVQIIEQLTERNLDLEAKIDELREEIADLEAINEVNDQLQENAREEERELRQNLDLAESRIRESEKHIESLKYNIADHEKTIIKFRDLVKQLQTDNDSIQRQLKSKLDEEKEMTMSQSSSNLNQAGTNFDFKQKFFESQIQSKIIENQINLIELNSLKKYNSYLLAFMSESFLKQSGNNECLLTLVFFKKISNKCDMLLNHFKEKKDQLDENISLDGLDKIFFNFQNILKNHLNDDKFDQSIYLEDLVKYLMYTSESLTVDLQKLNSIIETKDESSEIMLLFKEIGCSNDEIKMLIKKVQKNLPDRENAQNKKVLDLPNEFMNELEMSLENFSLISKTLKELYNLASTSKIFTSSANDSVEALSGKKLESLAYQACDKVYLKEDNGPYDNLRNSIKQIDAILLKTTSCLVNGECEKELTDEEFKIKKYQINSPAQKAAEQYKSTLIEAENIKFKLQDKEDEIKELKKGLKLKVDELSEQKLRISLVEKKAETQQKEVDEANKKLSEQIEEIKSESAKKEKEHSETLEALQQELDSLEKERRELKEKLRKTVFMDLIMNRQSSGNSEMPSSNSSNDLTSLKSQNSSMIDSAALIQEINVLKCQNKLLQKSLNEAKQAYVNKLLNDLPNQKSALKEQFLVINNDQLDEKQKSFVNLTKKSNDLLKDVYSSLANVKIENLKDRKSSKLNTIRFEEKNMYLTVNKIQEKIDSLQKDLQASNISTNKPILNEKRNLVAEISLPLKSSVEDKKKIIDLNMNFDEIKELLRNI